MYVQCVYEEETDFFSINCKDVNTEILKRSPGSNLMTKPKNVKIKRNNHTVLTNKVILKNGFKKTNVAGRRLWRQNKISFTSIIRLVRLAKCGREILQSKLEQMTKNQKMKTNCEVLYYELMTRTSLIEIFCHVSNISGLLKID